MARDAIEWLRTLCELGVRPDTAARWAPVFAEEINERTFSQGEREIPIFVAHILHESGMLERTEENLNYGAGRITEIGMRSRKGTRWRNAVPRAMELARNPRAFAEYMYGGRFGNSKPGDGWKYRGRGPGQVTFLDNYRWLGNLMGVDLVADPDLLLKPRWGLKAFIAYWENRVDDETLHDNEEVTENVNGGHHGLEERGKLTDLAKAIMNIGDILA